MARTTVRTRTVRPLTQMLTVDEACALMGVKKSWVYDQTQRGVLHGYKFGRMLRFREEDLHAWIEQQRG